MCFKFNVVSTFLLMIFVISFIQVLQCSILFTFPSIHLFICILIFCPLKLCGFKRQLAQLVTAPDEEIDENEQSILSKVDNAIKRYKELKSVSTISVLYRTKKLLLFSAKSLRVRACFSEVLAPNELSLFLSSSLSLYDVTALHLIAAQKIIETLRCTLGRFLLINALDRDCMIETACWRIAVQRSLF